MDEQNPRLLIVDDDKEIRELLANFLSRYGYLVSAAANGKDMFAQLARHTFDLIILDIMMPGDDGFSLCKQLRKDSNLPIIMLSAIGEETDRIIGLEVGADDYLPKPFNPRELVARIKAVLRRSQHPIEPEPQSTTSDSDTVVFCNWIIDKGTRKLLNPEGIEIILSAGEYTLLVAFLDHPRRVLSRDQLLEITHNRSAGPFDRSIDIQVSRLRQKIEVDPKQPELIKTVRGGGYMFTAKVTPQACHA